MNISQMESTYGSKASMRRPLDLPFISVGRGRDSCCQTRDTAVKIQLGALHCFLPQGMLTQLSRGDLLCTYFKKKVVLWKP